jgi:hypothetical protein
MAIEPSFVTIGTPTDKIDVLLSYRIVELFSEGLYSSPNKAIEELVANSFDAGALRVLVLHSANLHAQDATIAVIDDGEGMGIEDLKKHWLIGVSNKRNIQKLPKGRQQIGQFGIGKLATYVLADCLTHISKNRGRYFSTSMNYTSIDRRVQEEVQPKKPIRLVLRELTESEAKTALSLWTETAAFGKSAFPLFGKGAPASWTVAIMSSLKKKVHDIKPGMLEWVLRTALPLRPDFEIRLNGKKLTPSKEGKGLLHTFVLGKDIEKLPKPGPKGITTSENAEVDKKNEDRFGLEVPGLGRVTGYAEAYKDPLTGKSDEIGRSYGFFVFIRGRLINVVDGHFGIDPDKLRHGTFSRFRLIINIDILDAELRANRETVREGLLLETTQNLLWGIFNFVRPYIDNLDADELPGAKLARNLAGSPGSLSRQPIIELARAVVDGRTRSRYLIVPAYRTDEEKVAFIDALEVRVSKPENFVSDFTIDWDGTADNGFARYDTATGAIRINGWHPFVTTFQDEFLNKNARQPLEVLALAEILLEAHLHTVEVRQVQIDALLNARDQLLRTLANQSGRQSPSSIAQMLLEARNNPDGLENALCAAFTSLGCDVRPLGGKGKPDGVAVAPLAGDRSGHHRQYSIMLESKSKVEDKGKVAAGTVQISAVIRHRDQKEFDCDHALVLGRDFPTTQGENSVLAQDIAADKRNTAALQRPKTITLITIDDLAELVRLRPLRQIGLTELRDLFQCALPEDCRVWIARIRDRRHKKPPYKKIVQTIEAHQKKWKKSSVKYSGLREALSNLQPPIEYQTEEELAGICVALAQISERTMFANPETVEIDTSAANVVAAIEASMREYDPEPPTRSNERA